MEQKIKAALEKLSTQQKAKTTARFFKTGKGEYGEGDIFIGVTMPEQRVVARQHLQANFAHIRKLLSCKVHEHRLTALIILVEQYKQTNVKRREQIVAFYLKNLKQVNNWDLVDCSAPYILGEYLIAHPTKRKMLLRMVKSSNLWERRIAMVATLAFIRNQEFTHTLKLAQQLLGDTHDLMHKATGWMLREVGKKNQRTLEEFLNKHAHRMPRTILRYAIERMEEGKRKQYLNRKKE